MFSDKQLKALKPKATPYKVSEGGSDKGFGIQVSTAGTKSFFFQYREEGKVKFLNLGIYPDISISEAREKCRIAKSQVNTGINPKTNQIIGEPAKGTFQQLVDHYIEHLKANDKRTWESVLKALERDALPNLAHLQACDITPQHIKVILYKLIQRGSDVQANRVRSYLHTAFKQGIFHDNNPKQMGSGLIFGIKHNPVADIPRNAQAESIGERVLTDDEITNIFNYQGDAISIQNLNALKLIFAAGGQRSGEITRSTLDEFDFDAMVWSIPPERTKNKKWHLLPITPSMLEILNNQIALNGLNPIYLFPQISNKEKPQSGDTLSHATEKLCKREPELFGKFIPKDLRRTAKTVMGRLGVSKEIRDRLQNHALSDVSSRHYDR
jgi:integrase